MKLNKNIVIIVLVAVLLLGAIGFYFYKQGKKTVSIQYGAGELPGNPGSGTQLGASNEELKTIINGLYEDMNGFNMFGHNYEPYKRAILLSDNDLIKLYNGFNTLYQVESGETLTGWIETESYADSDITDSLIARLKKLNLK